MKHLLLSLLLLTTTYLHARIVHEFSNTPLTDALRAIEQSHHVRRAGEHYRNSQY